MSANVPVSYAVEDGIAVVRIANPPVNALSAPVRAGLVEAVRRADTDPAAAAIVIAAEGRTFVAGADITEFGKPPVPPTLPDVIAAFDLAQKPMVAAIGGAALGGGLELTLGCHARVASPAAKLGLPEVKLGLLPGAGGTQRLPRLIGAEPALKLMADGNPISAAEAAAFGLVDEVAAGDLLQAAKAKARTLVGRDLLRSRDAAELGPRQAFEAAAALLKRHSDSPSVAACVDAVRAAFDLPFEEGMARERAHFMGLLQDPRSKALRHVFFAEREAARIPGLAAGTAARTVERAAVIGGGTMGGGIAMCFANAGIPVTLIETGDEALQRGLARVAQTYDISVKRGSLKPEQRDARLKLIDGKVGLDAAGDADLVIEAVFEEMGLKKEIFGQLDRIAKPGAVLATNTSFLDVNEIAAATSRPQDALGMHFFSPANVMRLLEVVRGERTAPDALATAVQIAPKLGKVPVVVGVCYGFVGNRMLAARSEQVEWLLLEGALPEEIDAALTGFGFRMGPCAMGDLAGLDVAWSVRQPTGTQAPVADALYEAGRLGQKTGKGYFLYADGDRTPRPDPEVAALIERIAAAQGVTRRAVGAEEIVERLIYPMINEGARILEDGIAARPGDIDVVWLNGYGWPAWRGGPMFYADQVGLDRIAARLDEAAAQTGDATLRPAPLLRRLATQGSGFSSLPIEKAA
ncbi:MAG TPA: 3-hydroxyacyl-CoA dehydrogenase NAD-binding domain-containing protein [Acetobacteraceae bacterium]|jgi:3-hydroxyacyl-CoA dehydrogenase|nr:3-hydroxyacyl-CoA dehydrogenase NAD-binding domain-containing protein [Acetobacteraceae bacterium]